MHKYFPFILFFVFLCFSCTRQVTTSDAPYPPSKSITGITWADTAIRLTSSRIGDNWPITWVNNDTQITAYGDGDGFDAKNPKLTLGFSRITGDPPNVRGEDFITDADTPAGWGQKGIKASGLLMVDGILYIFIRNYIPPGSSDYTNSRLGWSTNGGINWNWADWYFSDTFGCPEFVQFGKNYEGARDNYVYVVSQANDNAYEFSPDIVLARVPKTTLLKREAYEFFAGFDKDNTPVWSADLAKRKPIFTDPRGTQRISVTYNAPLKRYILTSSHLPPGGKGPHTGALGIFDAPEPWGPWTTIYYNHYWSGECRTYHHKFPAKWISADGKTMWLLFSGLDCDYYTFCLKRVDLAINR